ncbi:hypothetical protein C0J52_04737, partial [Blattella germanica]
ILDTAEATNPSSEPTAESTEGVEPTGSSVQTETDGRMVGISESFFRGNVSEQLAITEEVDKGRVVPAAEGDAATICGRGSSRTLHPQSILALIVVALAASKTAPRYAASIALRPLQSAAVHLFPSALWRRLASTGRPAGQLATIYAAKDTAFINRRRLLLCGQWDPRGAGPRQLDDATAAVLVAAVLMVHMPAAVVVRLVPARLVEGGHIATAHFAPHMPRQAAQSGVRIKATGPDSVYLSKRVKKKNYPREDILYSTYKSRTFKKPRTVSNRDDHVTYSIIDCASYYYKIGFIDLFRINVFYFCFNKVKLICLIEKFPALNKVCISYIINFEMFNLLILLYYIILYYKV